MLHEIIIIGLGLNRKHHEAKRIKTVVACTQCGTEQPTGTRFCRKCGGTSLLAAGDYDVYRGQQRDAELKDLEKRQRRNAAIQRIKTLSTQPFCTACNKDFDDSPEFCPQCGANIKRQFIPDKVIFYTIKSEFPEFVLTMQDYTTLKVSPIERGINGRALALTASKLWDPFSFRPLSRPPKSRISSLDLTVALIVVSAIVLLIILISQDASSRNNSLRLSAPALPQPAEVESTPTPVATPLPEVQRVMLSKIAAEEEQAQNHRAAREAEARIETEKQAERVTAMKKEYDATVYNLERFSIMTESGVVGISVGTKLTIVSKNDNGTTRVKTDFIQLDVPNSKLTHDADLAARLRNPK